MMRVNDSPRSRHPPRPRRSSGSTRGTDRSRGFWGARRSCLRPWRGHRFRWKAATYSDEGPRVTSCRFFHWPPASMGSYRACARTHRRNFAKWSVTSAPTAMYGKLVKREAGVPRCPSRSSSGTRATAAGRLPNPEYSRSSFAGRNGPLTLSLSRPGERELRNVPLSLDGRGHG